MAPSLASPGHHCQPPAAAVTTSTWLPARTRVLGHSERGTTARSTRHGDPLGLGAVGQQGHHIGDGAARGHGEPIAVDHDGELVQLVHGPASRSTTALAVNGASRIPLR